MSQVPTLPRHRHAVLSAAVPGYELSEHAKRWVETEEGDMSLYDRLAAVVAEAERRAVEPWELLSQAGKDLAFLPLRYGHVVYSKRDQPQGKGSSWTEAARDLCAKLGLKLQEAGK